MTTPGFIRHDTPAELLESLRSENRMLLARVSDLSRVRVDPEIAAVVRAVHHWRAAQSIEMRETMTSLSPEQRVACGIEPFGEEWRG